MVRKVRAAVLTAAVVCSLSACGTGSTQTAPTSPATPGAQHTVRMKVIHHGKATLVLVPVTIHGKGPFAFLLDSGSSTSSISKSLASRLGLSPTGRTQTVQGVVSRTKVPLVRIAHWKLGDVDLGKDVVAAIQVSSREGSTVDGLLGSDELSGFGQVTLDFAHSKVRVTER